MKPVVLLVPTHQGGTGGEVYDGVVEASLSCLTKVRVVEVYEEVQAVKLNAAPFLRSWAFKPSIYVPIMIIRYTIAFAMCEGLILQNSNVCRFTWLAVMIRHLFGRKTITIVHHFEDEISANKARHMAYRRKCIGNSDKIITISQFSKAEVLRCGYSARKVAVIPPGTKHRVKQVNQRNVELNKMRYILSVGTCLPHKGFDVLVSAVGLCKVNDFEVIIAGCLDAKPDYVASLRSTIEIQGLQNRIRLIGRVSDEVLDVLFSDAYAYAMPSLMEGYCMAVAEGLSYGLPVITTTAGALPELITDGVEGLLAIPGDPMDLSSKLDKILGDRDFRNSCAHAAKVRAESLSTWEETGTSIQNICRPYLVH